ncbi:hypothetical protein [Catellatospora vulcania]|uniref:hypothetical protein n=1 Tax=Catellatospora vulcania TaxID=1460450 RepID=UPI0012D44C53|nr:hypothetical protein [Catellatospora vulcania]
MSQSLFSAFHSPAPDPKPPGDRPVKMQVLVTVKAAPNPSETYGETVCVAGVRADMTHPGFVRLYPINFRDLDSDDKFGKYQIITLEATPARQDQRRESWRPVLSSIEPGELLRPWKPRQVWLDDYVETSMCRVNADARERHDAKSLALIRPKEITDLVFEKHPGWTPDEQRKIDKYVAQPELYNPREKTPLQPPRFKGRYRYRCFEATCRGHEQGVLDWEFVMLQRQLAGHSDEHTYAQLRHKFVGMMCAPDRNTAFFVGNQAKRVRVFSVLGVYYPRR